MIIYISMIILTTFFGWLSQRQTSYSHELSNDSVFGKESYPIPTTGSIIAIFIVFVFVTGLQSGFGDTTSYKSQFINLEYIFPSSITEVWDAKAPLFQIFMSIIKRFTSDPQWLLFIVAIITNLFVCLMLKKSCYSVSIACYFYICMGLSLWSMNGIRQYIVATLLFLCHKLIIEGKPIKWFLLLFVCFFFHTSVVFLIPVYFLYRSKPWSKRMITFVIVILIIGVFYTRFSDTFFDIAHGTVFEEYEHQVDEVASTKIIRVLFMMIPAVLSFIYKKQIEEEESPLLNLAANATVLSAGIYILAGIGAGNLIGRIAVYSDLFVYVVFIPFLLKRYFEKSIIIPSVYMIAAGGFYIYQQFFVFGGFWYSDWLKWYFV